MNEDQLKAIIDGQGIDGATIGEWFSGWQRDDLERISRAVQKATVEQLTVSDIAKQIRGTKENDYNDGVLATTRVGAVRLARTVINGVCNNARVETIKANSDVIDGIKFVGTLDGKTCPHCASYDGHIWRGEDMASARRPPIHPNCRCTLVPYVELKDEDGNVVDIDNERPAANADFDQLAKDAYNQKAKEKGWKRRFEDLSPSTRLKYYYQAQKDYEKETGKPAYRQVDSNLSFPEYFKQQPDSFKRDWLGAKRYEAYKEGKLTEKAIFAPDLSYTVSPTSLVKFVEPEVPEELAKLVDEYEKKNTEESVPLNEIDNQYNPIRFSFDGTDNIDVLSKRWSKLSLDELSKISEEIDIEESRWKSLISAKEPQRDEYTQFADYSKAKSSWIENKSNGNSFWRSLVRVIRDIEAALLLQKRKKEFENPFASIMTPEEYWETPKTKQRINQIETYYNADKMKFSEAKADEIRKELYRDLILPLKPDKKSIKKMEEKLPKDGFYFSSSVDQGTKDRFEKGKTAFINKTKEGLENVARILINLGRSVDEIDSVYIDSLLVPRPKCSGDRISLAYSPYDLQDAVRKCAHEFGHGAIYVNKNIAQKEIELYERHSVKDKNGNYIYEILNRDGSEKARKLDFETPNAYTRREYLDSTGNVEATELTSKFNEYITEQPWLFFEKEYETYFTEMVNLWKKTN